MDNEQRLNYLKRPNIKSRIWERFGQNVPLRDYLFRQIDKNQVYRMIILSRNFIEFFQFRPNVGAVVIAALEYGILQVTTFQREPGYHEQGLKLVRAYFEFFVAQATLIYCIDGLPNHQDNNIDDGLFNEYKILLDQICMMTNNDIQGLALFEYANTFNATLTQVSAEVQDDALIHDPNINDNIIRFELLQWAIYHYHKHNIRDVYVDQFRKDQVFITAGQYLNQANDTKINSNATDVGRMTTLFCLKYEDDEIYSEHYRKTYVKRIEIGRRSNFYIESYFKCENI